MYRSLPNTKTWKTIPGFPDYQVSKVSGMVRRSRLRVGSPCGTSYLGKLLRTRLDRYGYNVVALTNKDGKACSCTIHKLVALTWLGPRPKGTTVNHKDTDKLNNRWTNLEYITSRCNTHHAIENGLRGQQTCLTKEIVRRALTLVVKHKKTIAEVARRYGASERTIHDVVHGHTWKDIKGPRLTKPLSSPPQTSLTDGIVERVLKLVVKKKCTIASVARKYEVGETTIRNIVYGRTWKHVEGPRL